MAELTEAEAVAKVVDLTQAGKQLLDTDTGHVWFLVPDGYGVQEIDHSQHLARPALPSGTVSVHDAASFLAAIADRTLPDVAPVVYADEQNSALVAILDDDHAATPGWRRYRVSLSLRRTPEWAAWKQHSGNNLPQAEFAEFIEERVADIIDPAGAVMLELAQSIEGTASADFSAGHRLQNGARQVMWKETVKATGGSGAIEIPPKFTIAVSPFFGAVPVDVDALLRFRINGGHLMLSYKLVDPAKVEREVFSTIVNEVAAARGADLPILRGPAPAEA
jgi:uncharacterized protein YfdQ (DUF2303 family)